MRMCGWEFLSQKCALLKQCELHCFRPLVPLTARLVPSVRSPLEGGSSKRAYGPASNPRCDPACLCFSGAALLQHRHSLLRAAHACLSSQAPRSTTHEEEHSAEVSMASAEGVAATPCSWTLTFVLRMCEGPPQPVLRWSTAGSGFGPDSPLSMLQWWDLWSLRFCGNEGPF